MQGPAASSLRTITAVLTDQAADEGALTLAIRLARKHGAHLDIVCLGLNLTALEGYPMAAAGVVTLPVMQDDSPEKAAALKSWVDGADLAGLLSSVTIRTATLAALPQLVQGLGRYSDLLVIGPPYVENAGGGGAGLVEAALFQTATPVLVVPNDPPQTLDRVVIAWDETDGAMAAIRGGLPLIAGAERADVVMVDPPAQSLERSDPGGALCVLLARHGARPEVSVLSKSLPRISDVILRFAADRQAEMVVMGGYGHSRLREALLGGVTREMLEHSPLPLLMAR